jgi:hypothetical protein
MTNSQIYRGGNSRIFAKAFSCLFLSLHWVFPCTKAELQFSKKLKVGTPQKYKFLRPMTGNIQPISLWPYRNSFISGAIHSGRESGGIINCSMTKNQNENKKVAYEQVKNARLILHRHQGMYIHLGTCRPRGRGQHRGRRSSPRGTGGWPPGTRY